MLVKISSLDTVSRPIRFSYCSSVIAPFANSMSSNSWSAASAVLLMPSIPSAMPV